MVGAWGLTPHRRNLAAILIFLQMVCALDASEHGPSESAFGPSLKGGQSLLESLSLPSNTEYELVAPFEVDHEGRYISHAVAHHQRRHRRALDRAEKAGTSELVHYRLSGLSQNFHLELRLSAGLITPGFKVQRLGLNGTASLQDYSPHDLCFYQGLLRSKVNSSVAMTTCGGMSGLIRTQEADYLIRPVHPHLASSANFSTPPGHQPHILYKRSTDPQPEPARTARHRRHHGDGLHPDRQDNKPGPGQKQHFCGRRKKCM
ncbi:hypothetical protein ACEWY4_020395 [Coilia grayii]|uniref:Peptidase M12B propeptide domain-containing protein n=1 Tax=Coilia grayii TaxID=363190 RepID=A0ABD1JCH1_9TELE